MKTIRPLAVAALTLGLALAAGAQTTGAGAGNEPSSRGSQPAQPEPGQPTTPGQDPLGSQSNIDAPVGDEVQASTQTRRGSGGAGRDSRMERGRRGSPAEPNRRSPGSESTTAPGAGDGR